MTTENNGETIIIGKKTLAAWHNKLCAVEIKLLNAANIMSVIGDIENILINCQNIKSREEQKEREEINEIVDGGKIYEL